MVVVIAASRYFPDPPAKGDGAARRSVSADASPARSGWAARGSAGCGSRIVSYGTHGLDRLGHVFKDLENQVLRTELPILGFICVADESK
jgi:hypothetical protein